MNLLRIICKIVGGILVFSGGCGCGIWMAGRKKKRINILRELEQVLIFLYGEIEYAGADIVEIFQRLAEKTDYFQSFFREMGMETGDGTERQSRVRLPGGWTRRILCCGRKQGSIWERWTARRSFRRCRFCRNDSDGSLRRQKCSMTHRQGSVGWSESQGESLR